MAEVAYANWWDDRVITSLQNQRVKDAVKLRGRRGRARQGRTLIDGPREMLRAIEAGVPLVEIFACRGLCTSDESRRVLEWAEQTGAELLDVTPAVFGKLAFGERTEGVLAVAQPPHKSVSELAESRRELGSPPGAFRPRPLIAVLDGLEKPGNVGAVIRTADGAGLSAVIVADGGTDLFNPNAIRASLGTIFTVPLCSANGDDAKSWLLERNIAIVAADVAGTRNYFDIDFTRPTAIVLGSEAGGLSGVWQDPRIETVRLPMHGAADTLNVSATAAVLFYEARRQRSVDRLPP